jgi:hypothetical protein
MKQTEVKKIYESLIGRCMKVQEFYVQCIIDENWVPQGPAPFDMRIDNGIFTFRVIAFDQKEAMKKVCDKFPVIKILNMDVNK